MISPVRENLSSANYVRALVFLFTLVAFFSISTQALPSNNPIPYVSTISPLAIVPGGAGFNVTVNGANFVAASVCELNRSMQHQLIS
jgi:hypothetical protein